MAVLFPRRENYQDRWKKNLNTEGQRGAFFNDRKENLRENSPTDRQFPSAFCSPFVRSTFSLGKPNRASRAPRSRCRILEFYCRETQLCLCLSSSHCFCLESIFDVRGDHRFCAPLIFRRTWFPTCIRFIPSY